MLLEFDEAKSARNVERRGIGFERFADIDFDRAVTSEDRRKDYGEPRLRVLAHIDGRLHTAVITPRGERVRVISLRRASRREERTYAKERQSA
jgi:uncharacterized DUF497 family protein